MPRFTVMSAAPQGSMTIARMVVAWLIWWARQRRSPAMSSLKRFVSGIAHKDDGFG